jgi:uncharacterized membrane protein
MASNPLELAATPSRLRQLARQGSLTSARLERALRLVGHYPDQPAWARFINYALLALGSAFTVSGVFFFFAYNWADMHRFLKFGVIECALLLAVAVAFYQGLHSLVGKAALIIAACGIGVLQAVYGQVYQTGADSYLLFLGWALLLAGWVCIGANALLWFIWLVLLNLTLIFYWQQIIGWNVLAFETLTALNFVALAAWEGARLYGLTWLQGRWLPRLIACAVFIPIVIPTLQFVIMLGRNFSEESWQLLAPVMFGSLVVLAWWVYTRPIRDVFVLTLGALSLMSVLTTGLGRLFFDKVSSPGGILFAALVIGGAVITQAALAFHWLREQVRATSSAA